MSHLTFANQQLNMNERIQNVCPWEERHLKKEFSFYNFYLCLLIQYNYLFEHIFAKRIICKTKICSDKKYSFLIFMML